MDRIINFMNELSPDAMSLLERFYSNYRNGLGKARESLAATR